MKKSILFVNFLEDNYSKDVAMFAERKLQAIGYQLKFASHGSVLEERDGVRIDNLYRPETIDVGSLTGPKYSSILSKSRLIDEARLMFLRSSDRVFLKCVSTRYLEWYFDLLVDYWVEYLQANRIAVIVFDATPHFPWDIPLFFIGKELGIDIIIIRRTFYSDAITFCDDYRSSVSNFYQVQKEFRFDLKSEKKVSLIEKWAAKIIEESLKNAKSSSINLTCLIKLIKYLINYKKIKIDYFKLNLLEVAVNLVIRRIQAWRALRFYRNNSSPILNLERYALFALHFRPERSTVPEGGGYSGQINAIKKFREALPSNIRLILKEHPRQLGDCPPDLRRVHQHEILLYKELLKLPNTFFAPIDCDQDSLIFNSCLTASITGSVVWEGLLLGRPGVTFANTWHNGCASSPDIANEECLAEKIKLLIAKSKEEVLTDVSRFLAVMAESVAVGARSENLSSNSEFFTRAELVEKLSGALVGY